MGASALRMQLRCAVRPSPLASQRGFSNCEQALARSFTWDWGIKPGLGGTPRTGGAYPVVDDRSRKLTRAKSGGSRATESGTCQMKQKI